MATTNRYIPDTESGEFLCATKHPEGDFVHYSDYEKLVVALRKLARLGNEPYLGNSRGNEIAIDALKEVEEEP